MAEFVTQVGEAFVGSGADAAHINTVLGRKGGPVEGAWATALATPSQGHVPVMAVLQPGVAQGVAEAVSQGRVPRERVDDLLLIAAVWVNPAAENEDRIFANNAQATLEALAAGADRAPEIERVLGARSDPFNPYFRPRE